MRRRGWKAAAEALRLAGVEEARRALIMARQDLRARARCFVQDEHAGISAFQSALLLERAAISFVEAAEEMRRREA